MTSSAIPLAYSSGVTIGITPYSHPVASLYHAQDNHGQYAYGYATPTSTKSETKTADGVTQGGYSYIDSHGILQTVNYIADAIHGFRVAATNLPQVLRYWNIAFSFFNWKNQQDLPEVAYEKAKHLASYRNIQAEHAQIGAQRAHQAEVNLLNLPQPVQDLPEVVAARNNHLAALQAATSASLFAPQPVQDLPEVVKARAEHLALVEQTKARDAAINLSPVPADFGVR